MRIRAKIYNEEWMGIMNGNDPNYIRIDQIAHFGYGPRFEITLKGGEKIEIKASTNREKRDIELIRNMMKRQIAGIQIAGIQITEKKKNDEFEYWQLDLSVRTINGLKQKDIHTYRELFQLKKEDFKNIRGFGDKSWRELSDYLKELKLGRK